MVTFQFSSFLWPWFIVIGTWELPGSCPKLAMLGSRPRPLDLASVSSPTKRINYIYCSFIFIFLKAIWTHEEKNQGVYNGLETKINHPQIILVSRSLNSSSTFQRQLQSDPWSCFLWIHSHTWVQEANCYFSPLHFEISSVSFLGGSDDLVFFWSSHHSPLPQTSSNYST